MSRRSYIDEENNKEDKTPWGLWIIAIIVIFGFAGGYWYLNSDKEVLDKTTYCPISGAEGHTVILIDKTDPLNFTQQQSFDVLMNNLIKEKVPEKGLVSVFALGENFTENDKPLIQLCNPGDGSDKSKITDNIERLKKRYNQDFVEPLKAISSELVAREPAKYSPVFEQIQMVAINGFKRQDISGEKRLIIVSDMLQNTPDYSMYRQQQDFEQFQQSHYAQKVRADLGQVKVELYYIMNSPKYQTQRHLNFWQQYFNQMGAKVVFVEPLAG